MNVNVHLHVLLLDGVFSANEDGTLHFHPATSPTDLEVARLLATIRTRIVRLLCRRGINLALPAGARQQLEGVCRYLLRPAVAEDRLALAPQGQVLLHLRHRWTDGTTHLLFEPLELLEKLAALTPRPRINLLLYHGVLAPRARWRNLVAAYGRSTEPPTLPAAATSTLTQAGPGNPAADGTGTPRGAAPAAHERVPTPTAPERRATWATLMRRAFDFEVLTCPRCGGRMRLIATIEDPAVISKILRHLGLSTDVPEPLPARSPPDPASISDDLAF